MHNRITFDELLAFSKNENGMLQIGACVIDGNVQRYYIEKGLQASVWNCHIEEPLELYSTDKDGTDADCLTLAYFQDTTSISFVNRHTLTPCEVHWDYVLFSSSSDYSIRFSPGIRITCLTIAFSKKWLFRISENNKSLEELLKQIGTCPKLFLTGTTTNSHRKHVEDFVFRPTDSRLGAFYTKSAVLKILADLLHSLKEGCGDMLTKPLDLLTQVEEQLCKNITHELPDMKALASSSRVSESTLKRKFKKKFGITMSAYYVRKKMEYASALMKEQFSLSKVARMVGYRSVQKFSSMYKKFVSGKFIPTRPEADW